MTRNNFGKIARIRYNPYSMDITIFGWIGGTLTNLSLLPQIIKAIRTKSVNDISITMFLMLFTGIFCWFIYGILLGDRVLILMNLLSLFLVGTMIFLYYRYHAIKHHLNR